MFDAKCYLKVLAIWYTKHNFSPVLQNSNGSVLQLRTDAGVCVARIQGENGSVE
jgi:hypothetical protein